MGQENNTEKKIAITIQYAKTKKHDCILCENNEIQQGKKYYDIEIHTTKKTHAQAIIISLASTKDGFDGDYDRLTKINMQVCELHYGNNISDHVSLNQEYLVNFDEFKKIFLANKLETVE
ncbi:MAG: hypothetical protein WCL02_05385 [bacterium]